MSALWGKAVNFSTMNPLNNRKYFHTFVFIFFFLIGLFVYSNVVKIPYFYWDSKGAIATNVFIRDLSNLKLIWSTFNTRFVVGLSFALNYSLGQLNPCVYRITNLVFHILSSFFVYRLVSLTFQTPYFKNTVFSQKAHVIAVLSGCIFLTHPLQSEAVNYINQRYIIFAAFFYLATMILYIKARLDNRKAYYVGAFLCMILAMFSKEISITLPIMLVVYEIFFLNLKKSDTKQFLILIPFLCALCIIPLSLMNAPESVTGAARMAVTTSDGSTDITGGAWGTYSRTEYFRTQWNVLRTYGRLFVWPIHQNFDYDYPISHSWFESSTFLSGLFLFMLLFLACKWYRQHRLFSFCIVWFFCVLSVESSVIPLAHVIAEYRTYLAMFAYALLVPSVLFLKSKNDRRALVLTIIVILLLSALTFKRNFVWQDQITLWSDTHQKSPRKLRVLNNLGIAYYEDEQYQQAKYFLEESLEHNPNQSMPYLYLGYMHTRLKNNDQALHAYKKAITLNPSFVRAYVSLGYFYSTQGKYNEAIGLYEKALEIDPTDYLAHQSLIMIYQMMGEKEKSIQQLRNWQNLMGQ